jgi:phenylpyruvate tautomerase PptA (4-oxalocrotonate tautomerase family)
MPYLRVYARDLPIEQKRVIAEKLIETTLRTFELGTDQRYRTSIQFISLPQVCGMDGLQPAIPRDADFTLEVMGHNLTEEKKRAFAEEAAAMLTRVAPVKLRSRIAHLLGIKADQSPRIALQFNELSQAISDPFVVNPLQRAA